MHTDDASRRAFLAGSAAALGAVWTRPAWAELLAAVARAREAVRSPTPPAFEVLTPAQAGDVEALTAQIIPSGDTPGAREAGVVYFIDRALATFAADQRPAFETGLAEVEKKVAEMFPAVTTFAALGDEAQQRVIRGIESGAFFQQLWLATTLGMFALPSYGGNRDWIGWRLLGIEDHPAYQPPFGEYDRDYQEPRQ